MVESRLPPNTFINGTSLCDGFELQPSSLSQQAMSLRPSQMAICPCRWGGGLPPGPGSPAGAAFGLPGSSACGRNFLPSPSHFELVVPDATALVHTVSVTLDLAFSGLHVFNRCSFELHFFPPIFFPPLTFLGLPFG